MRCYGFAAPFGRSNFRQADANGLFLVIEKLVYYPGAQANADKESGKLSYSGDGGIPDEEQSGNKGKSFLHL
jgi:hypothetical protein